MVSILLAIVSFVASAVSVVGTVFNVINGFFEGVAHVIANSKIFLTIALLALVVACFTAMHTLLDYALDVDYSETNNIGISVGLLEQFCSWRKLVSLANWALSYWITEKIVFSTAFGYRMLQIFVGRFANAVKV